VIWFAGIALLMPACISSKDKIPSDIMPEKKMRQVFTDALIAEAYVMENTVQQDSQKRLANIYYNKIFDRYHITKDAYYRSYDYYSAHPEIFEKLMGPIIDSLTAMEARTPSKPMNAKPIAIGPAQPLPSTALQMGRKPLPLHEPPIKK